MKKIQLTPALAELIDIETEKKKNEKWTSFVANTSSVLNGGVRIGQLRYNDVTHFKKVRKAFKALLEYRDKAVIFLEDVDYELLFGKEGGGGIIRAFGGWTQNEFTDEYLEAWESAATVSAKEMQTFLKKEIKKSEESDPDDTAEGKAGR